MIGSLFYNTDIKVMRLNLKTERDLYVRISVNNAIILKQANHYMQKKSVYIPQFSISLIPALTAIAFSVAGFYSSSYIGNIMSVIFWKNTADEYFANGINYANVLSLTQIDMNKMYDLDVSTIFSEKALELENKVKLTFFGVAGGIIGIYEMVVFYKKWKQLDKVRRQVFEMKRQNANQMAIFSNICNDIGVTELDITIQNMIDKQLQVISHMKRSCS